MWIQVPYGFWLLETGDTGFILRRSQGVPCCLLLLQPGGTAGGCRECWASPVVQGEFSGPRALGGPSISPGENLQGCDQVSPNVSLARWYCTWTKILAFMPPWELLSITVDACLMITSEGFSLISHLGDGWSHKSLMILIFMNSYITFVDFDFPWPVKTFRWTFTRLRSSGRYFPKV